MEISDTVLKIGETINSREGSIPLKTPSQAGLTNSGISQLFGIGPLLQYLRHWLGDYRRQWTSAEERLRTVRLECHAFENHRIK